MTYKGYRIEALGTFPLFKVSPPGSGKVPKELSGSFTSMEESQRAIDRSFGSLSRRGRKNGKKEGTATS